MRSLAPLALVLLVAGCLAPGTTPHVVEVEKRPLDRGSFSGIHEDTRVLLRDAAAWDALWARHRPNATAPSVSFPNESVVAIVEHGPTGCFGIHVGNVTYDAAARVLTVEVVHVTTPPNVQCIQALQDAYDFVAIPDRVGDARFVDRDEPGGGSGETPPPREPARGPQSGIEGGLRQLVRDEAT